MSKNLTLCVFNPEHDLCLANGDPNYVPPASALDFARRGAGVMHIVYGNSVIAIASDGYSDWRRCNPNVTVDRIIPWGWDARLCRQLYKQGVDPVLMPSEEEINILRHLQHRSVVLPLQPDCYAVTSVSEMQSLLTIGEDWVMKAPWSGAGRGIRWVHRELSLLDIDWLLKTVVAQQCVIAEPRRNVVANVALEYVDSHFAGYSFLNTSSGVYRENILWDDGRITIYFSNTSLQTVKKKVEEWLVDNIWQHYIGPLGVDLMVCANGEVYVSEINLRHTMGLVACYYLRQNPEKKGQIWTPESIVC